MKAALLIVFLPLACLAQHPLVTGAGIDWTRASGDTFSASNPAGLVIWINPTNSPDTTTDGGNITFVTNSANSALFTPLVWKYSSGTKMIYRSSAANGGQACFYCNGALYDSSIGGGASEPSTNWPTPYWIFAAVRATNSAASNGDLRMNYMEGGGGGELLVSNSLFQAETFGSSNLIGTFNYTNRWVWTGICFSNVISYFFTNGQLCVQGGAGNHSFGNHFYLGSAVSAQYIWRGFVGDVLVYSGNLTPAGQAVVNNHFIAKYALPDTSSHPSSTLVSSASVAGPRNNFSGHVGFFFVPNQDLYVTDLGRWVISGNSGTHTGVIYQPASTLLGSVSINTSGATAGQFTYASLSSVVFLKAGTLCALENNEANGGDQWNDCPNTSVTLTADGIPNSPGGSGSMAAASESQQNICGGQPQSPNNPYGPPSMKYWTP